MKSFFLLIIMAFALQTSAQTSQRLRSNFAGVETQLDFIHSSLGTGITYERMLALGQKAGFSVKAKYFFPHRDDNSFNANDNKSNVISSQRQASINGYIFLDKKERPGGAFLYGSLGLMHTRRIEKKPEGKLDFSGVSAGGESGIGGHARLGKNSQLQLKLGLLVYAAWGDYDYSSYIFRDNDYFSPVFSVAVGF